MPIVSNAGPILSFARANRLSLLQDIVGELIIPNAVYEEIVMRGEDRPGVVEVQNATWINSQSVTDHVLVNQLPRNLHQGEREAIALAKELNAKLLIDEREARKQALRLGIEHFGSLYVLKKAKESHSIQLVKPVLDELISSGTYINEALYHEFLALVGE